MSNPKDQEDSVKYSSINFIVMNINSIFVRQLVCFIRHEQVIDPLFQEIA